MDEIGGPKAVADLGLDLIKELLTPFGGHEQQMLGPGHDDLIFAVRWLTFAEILYREPLLRSAWNSLSDEQRTTIQQTLRYGMLAAYRLGQISRED